MCVNAISEIKEKGEESAKCQKASTEIMEMNVKRNIRDMVKDKGTFWKKRT